VRARVACLAFLLALGFGVAPAAHAYEGGPTLFEMLGYERATQRIYYVMHYIADGGPASTLWYFPLADSTPWQPVRAGWTSEEPARPESLLCRLELVPPTSRRGVKMKAEVLRTDTLTLPLGERVSRRLLGVDLSLGECRGRAEVVTYCDSLVDVAGVFSFSPQDGSSIWYTVTVLGYTGDWYGCEEVQAPILIPNHGAPVRRVETRR
jgi:hypothetical protein